MKTLLRVSIILAIVVFLTTAAFSQTTRINFARGARSTVVTGTLRGMRDHKTFVIHVRRGQTLTTESAGSKYITVEITAPPGSTYDADLAADCHDHQIVKPTAAGDYRIKVTECEKADAWRGSFRLRVTVR